MCEECKPSFEDILKAAKERTLKPPENNTNLSDDEIIKEKVCNVKQIQSESER